MGLVISGHSSVNIAKSPGQWSGVSVSGMQGLSLKRQKISSGLPYVYTDHAWRGAIIPVTRIPCLNRRAVEVYIFIRDIEAGFPLSYLKCRHFV